MQFLIDTSIWFQEWVPLFVNYAEKNSQLGQIWQDIKNPIKMKHSPVIHVTLLPIQNEVWMSMNDLENKICSDKSTFQTNKRKQKLAI